MKNKLSIIIVFSFLSITGLYASNIHKNINVMKDTIHVIGHAHMDMDWLWTYSETMKMANDNLRQAVSFMKQYPDFTMLQSQAAVYNFVEQTDPLLFKKIQKYVAEGRLEPVGGMWVESDQNIPSGEALTRSFLLGQRYFKSKFGRMARVGWLPDDFGHISQLPQILKLSGCNYYYFMRCAPYPGSFWWVGADNSKVLCYNNNPYNGKISEMLKDNFQKYPGGNNRIFCPTGVGDHGGGPTKANIDSIHLLNLRSDFPTIKFTTAENFFKNLSKEMNGRPTHYGEMQFVFEGCYSNVSEIKEYNRKCENSLYEGEFFNTMNWLHGVNYPSNEFHGLWQSVAFNQFHDILPGSAIYESNRESVARYIDTFQRISELRDKAFLKYVDNIPYKKHLGQPIVAFNLQPYSRKAIIEADVFSYEMPKTAKLSRWNDIFQYKNVTPINIGQGANVPSVLVQDSEGNKYPAQIIAGKVFPPGYRSKVQFVVDSMPAGGYKTFYIDTTKPGVSNDSISFSNNIFETDYYKITIDPVTGNICSLVDKSTQKEYVKSGEELNTLRMYLETKKGKMKSWLINQSTAVEEINNMVGKIKISDGPVRACVESEKVWGKSRFKIRTYIYRSYPRIDYDVDINWLENGSDSTDSPMLRTVFPLKMSDSRFFCQVPFNVIERPADGKLKGEAIGITNKEDPNTVERKDGQEVPAQKWADISDGQYGFALMTKSKYGYCFDKGELRLTLMRSAGYPDIYPNLGKFNIQYSIYPHSGDWTNGILQEGESYNVPAYAAEPLSTSMEKAACSYPAEKSLISLDNSNILLSAIKKCEDSNKILVRLCEMEGKEAIVHIKVPVLIKSIERLNLLEYHLDNASTPSFKDNIITLHLKKHEIVTLGIEYK